MIREAPGRHTRFLADANVAILLAVTTLLSAPKDAVA